MCPERGPEMGLGPIWIDSPGPKAGLREGKIRTGATGQGVCDGFDSTGSGQPDKVRDAGPMLYSVSVGVPAATPEDPGGGHKRLLEEHHRTRQTFCKVF